ncbi:ribosome recycling factor [Clostridium sp. FAM 1755]|uniref:Ribosome-recycling factor n=2 Tax=Clostridium TaxID=1485 RepID=A0A6M0SXA5_CLOBO|nr:MULTISPECIES: ribosome recycling factor [Clostridium]NFA59320.1 ribosome recycling factor [Clostridium botulinum]KOR26863.1 ribosome recycling factor [Clostridium sp. L74]MDS1002261.1 ribosome recycling factor [Clostridium sporogenes]NFI72738.1 ribosome recycling factor [Clostridium sporogenes]NFL73923.1 ribosome recycling factor [Clostridium sporogenes]
MIKEIFKKADDKMGKSIEALKRELSSMKAGRANPAMLDRIEAEYYGSMTPLNQLANISVPEARVLSIQPWDKSSMGAIEKAILKSDLGLNPSNDGAVIRLIIPELTEETRKNIVKTVKKAGEETKVAIRSIRRDCNDDIKNLKKDDVSEDDIKKAEEDIQKKTDKFIKEVDSIISAKEKEILSI